MAVDYTKVFTIIGSYVDKVQDYYALVDVLNNDQDAIEAVLASEDVVDLGDGLPEVYDTLRRGAVGWVNSIIAEVTAILTDPTLVGNELSLGTNPTITNVLPALIADMAANDKNVTASVSTVGTIVYDTTNANAGKVAVGTKLDGTIPVTSGAPIIMEYAGLTSQMVPDNEPITLTCTTDSESGGTRGAETFAVTGTGAQSSPYSIDGENIGTPTSLRVTDTQAATYLLNASFDTWTGVAPNDWVVTGGTAGTSLLEEATITLTGTGKALRLVGTPAGEIQSLEQDLNPASFPRKKAFFVSVWARKAADALADTEIELDIIHDVTSLGQISLTPTGTAWVLGTTQVVIPDELGGLDFFLRLRTGAAMDSDLADPVIVDQIVITPCVYVAGVAIGIFGGPDKFLKGDTIEIPLSNNNAGEFQSFFRKAYRVQLPTDASPTISDALVT